MSNKEIWPELHFAAIQSTYDAAVNTAKWDRDKLERK